MEDELKETIKKASAFLEAAEFYFTDTMFDSDSRLAESNADLHVWLWDMKKKYPIERD